MCLPDTVEMSTKLLLVNVLKTTVFQNRNPTGCQFTICRPTARPRSHTPHHQADVQLAAMLAACPRHALGVSGRDFTCMLQPWSGRDFSACALYVITVHFSNNKLANNVRKARARALVNFRKSCHVLHAWHTRGARAGFTVYPGSAMLRHLFLGHAIENQIRTSSLHKSSFALCRYEVRILIFDDPAEN